MKRMGWSASWMMLIMLTSSAAFAQFWSLNRIPPKYRFAKIFESNRAIQIAGKTYALINFTDRTVSGGNIEFIGVDCPVLDAFEFADGSIECIYYSQANSSYNMFEVTSSGSGKPRLLPVGEDAIMAGVLDHRFLVFSEKLEFVAIDGLSLNPSGEFSIKKFAKPDEVKSQSLACIAIPGTHNLVDIVSKDDDSETVVVIECKLAQDQITPIATWQAVYKNHYRCLSISRDEKTGKHFVWTLGNGSHWLEQYVATTGEFVRGVDEPVLRRTGGTRPPGYIFVWDNGTTLEVTNYRNENFGHFNLDSEVQPIDLRSNETLMGRSRLRDKNFRVAYIYVQDAPIPITVVNESDDSAVHKIEMPDQPFPHLLDGPNGAVYLFGHELHEIYELNKSDGKLTKVDLKKVQAKN